MVAKCQKASSKAVVAAHGTPQGLDPTRCAEIDNGTDEGTHDTETNSLIATLKKTLSEMSAHAANFRPGNPRKENEADILTKPLDAITFRRHRQSILGVRRSGKCWGRGGVIGQNCPTSPTRPL